MFSLASLDPREAEILEHADQFYANRFLGQGRYDKLGPFTDQESCIDAVVEVFRREDEEGEEPPTRASKPFLIYASASSISGSQVAIGNVTRDGGVQETRDEFMRRIREERARVAKLRRSGNRNGTA